jgi:hypothetical protein
MTLIEELRLIGCHANGDARCTCGIGQDAADEIERLTAALAATRALLLYAALAAAIIPAAGTVARSVHEARTMEVELWN